MALDVFPTGSTGTKRGRGNRRASQDHEGCQEASRPTINIAEYGTKIDKAFSRLNEILETSGKKKLKLGLGAQVFRGVIPLVAINGKIASLAEVPKKEALYTKIKVALKPPLRREESSQDPLDRAPSGRGSA